jgi:hypothetical protein
VRITLGIGKDEGDLLNKTKTAHKTERKRNTDTPTSALPVAKGFSIGGRRLDAGSTESIIVKRIGSPHSGQLPSAESDLRSYPHRAQDSWRFTTISRNWLAIGDS